MAKVPTPKQFKQFLADHGVTDQKAAEILVSYSARAVRSFCTETGPSARTLPYPVWYTLHHKITGKVPRE